jgi:hypothetical protein
LDLVSAVRIRSQPPKVVRHDSHRIPHQWFRFKIHARNWNRPIAIERVIALHPKCQPRSIPTAYFLIQERPGILNLPPPMRRRHALPSTLSLSPVGQPACTQPGPVHDTAVLRQRTNHDPYLNFAQGYCSSMDCTKAIGLRKGGESEVATHPRSWHRDLFGGEVPAWWGISHARMTPTL